MGNTLEIPGHAVALTGCGAVSALGLGLPPLAGALERNDSGLRPCVRFEGKGYQSVVCGWVPDEIIGQLRAEDPLHADARAFLLAAATLRQAAEDSATPVVLPRRRALVLSTTKGDIEALEQWCCPGTLARIRAVHGEAGSVVAQCHPQPALLAEELAAAHEIQGPVQCVSAACVSGLLALQHGAALIANEEADVVFVTGVDLISHFVLAGFTSLKSLDPEGCRPFDQARVGLSLGEGAATVVLARLDLAFDARALLTGWGSSNDANHLTGPSRDGAGLALAISRALDKAGLSGNDMGYVNAHGTGTAYNDNMESLALRRVFGDGVPPFSSSKGMLGHTLGAAGLLETILCLIALEKQTLPGTPRLGQPDPMAPLSLVREPRSAPGLRRVLKVNCGFAGTNVAVVLERASPPGGDLAVCAPPAKRAANILSAASLDPCRTGADGALRMANSMAILAASYVGPEGHGNDLTGLRPWTPDLAGPFQRGELDTLHWSLLCSGDASRFGRMDLMCRLGMIATELLDARFEQREPGERERMGVCVETRAGSLVTDLQFLQTPRPSLFTYTLPSTVIGEVCIRHRLQGPVLCLLTGPATDGRSGAISVALDWLRTGAADAVLCLGCEAVTRQLGESGFAPEIAQPGVWHGAALLLGRRTGNPRERALAGGSVVATCRTLVG